MTFEMYSFAAGGLIILSLFIWVVWLQNKLGKLLVGKSKTLDESLSVVEKDIADLKKFQSLTENTLKETDRRLRKTVSGVETIRFNPFKGDGSGGNQSFATAFLSEEKNGVVISSLYARDHVSVFSKPIKNLQSEQGELTGEEKEALEQAMSAIKK